MGYGGRRGGRRGSTSRQESNEGSKEKKDSESKPAGVKISADEIRKLVAKFLRDSELSSNTNSTKAPRFLNKISEEIMMVRAAALGFMSKLTGNYMTDHPEFIEKYIEADSEARRYCDHQENRKSVVGCGHLK
jgi:hypothetical protein